MRTHGRSRSCFTPLAATEHNRIPRFLCSVPPAISIHREITADDCGNLRAGFFQLVRARLEKVGTACGRSIAAVGEGVHHDVGDAGGFRLARERDEVFVMAVHSAVGKQSEKMELVSSRAHECFARDRIAGELTIRDRLVDSSEILINDPARAEIEMAHLRVSHLSFRQTNIETTRA